MFSRLKAQLIGVPLAIALGVTLVGSSLAHDLPVPGRQYLLFDIGTLGGEQSMPLAINDNGVVVGWAEVRRPTPTPTVEPVIHAFQWLRGEMIDLETLGGAFSEARDVNNFGEIVGRSTLPDGRMHAFVYMDGIMFDLNEIVRFPPTPFEQEITLFEANGISDEGNIVGCSTIHGSRDIHGYLLVRAPGVTAEDLMYRYYDLGALPGDTVCIALDVNMYDTVVGLSGDHAFLWRDRKMVRMDWLSRSSIANAINVHDEIVGCAAVPAIADDMLRPPHAMLWTGGARIDLQMTTDWLESEALDVNDAGRIVGWARHTPASPPMAVIWDRPHQPQILQEVTKIPIRSDGFQWAWLEQAIAINESGRLVGYGCDVDGKVQAFFAAPYAPVE